MCAGSKDSAEQKVMNIGILLLILLLVATFVGLLVFAIVKVAEIESLLNND